MDRFGHLMALAFGVLALAALKPAQAEAPLAAPSYHAPPAPIPAMLDAPPTPSVLPSRGGKTLAVFGRENLPSVAALARPILRLGGYRIDPRTNGPAEIRMNWLTSLEFEDIATGKTMPVALPKGIRFAEPQWSPDGRRLAFLVRQPAGLELWVAGPGVAAKALTPPLVNAAFGLADAYTWAPDSAGLILSRTVVGRGAPPPAPTVPLGPTIQESSGKPSAIRTYEDLLTNPHDEALFDYYFTSQLERVSVSSARPRLIGAPGLFIGFHLSPDGRYLEVERLKRPFSYVVPAERFPTELAIWSVDGKPLKIIADRPLTDALPTAFDAVTPFARQAEWRADAPATLVWALAQDGGDTDRKVDIHDRLMMLSAPFNGPPVVLGDLKDRFAAVMWGKADTALVITRYIKTRRETRILVDPSGHAPPRVLLERNYQDQYNNPGLPILAPGPFGPPTLQFASDGSVLMTGEGASRDGEHPFLSALDLKTGRSTVLWQAQDPYYERVVSLLGPGQVLTRRESREAPPNYFVRTLSGGAPRALTQFPDPEPQFAKVQKALITYARADGVPLSGMLYLPAGYERKRDGPLPLLMWAYPAEFTDAAVAGQVVDTSKTRFYRPQGINPVFLVTQGYAVLDGPSFPIIGEKGAEPNDTYIEQLAADAKAAVDAVVDLGVTDKDHIAVGGHSYGAFMTANLLAHTDLFRAGIARSGAYNRTLTPFGFQAEQRTYWQAKATYDAMSPFNYAPNIKAPILLIHGEADDNSGTFPIQSERFYAALKGAGATVRYVVLPNEPHGYRGRESTGDVLWEMTDWLDRYVKHAGPRPAAPVTAAKAAN